MQIQKYIFGDFFNKVFIDGNEIRVTNSESSEDDGIYKIEVKDLGKLKLTTGEIIFADTLSSLVEDTSPFSIKVTPGEYQVQACLLSKGEREKVGFLRVIFKNETAVLYNMAMQEGEEIESLPEYGILGTGVDSATAGFLDNNIKTELVKIQDENEDLLYNKLEESEDSYNNWFANIIINRETGENVVMASTGYGDGHYPSYFGMSEKNEVVCLVSDYYVIPWHTNNIHISFGSGMDWIWKD